MRIGLLEMHEFCLEFFEGVKAETFLMESSGVADVITSCKWAWCLSSIVRARLSVRSRRNGVDWFGLQWCSLSALQLRSVQWYGGVVVRRCSVLCPRNNALSIILIRPH